MGSQSPLKLCLLDMIILHQPVCRHIAHITARNMKPSHTCQLSNEDIKRQIDYMIRNNWTPSLEFSEDGDVYLNTQMGPGYYDNRYWSMYKLPMFGCRDSNEVVREIENCKNEFRSAKIRVIGFDPRRQVQTAGFIVKK